MECFVSAAVTGNNCHIFLILRIFDFCDLPFVQHGAKPRIIDLFYFRICYMLISIDARKNSHADHESNDHQLFVLSKKFLKLPQHISSPALLLLHTF